MRLPIVNGETWEGISVAGANTTTTPMNEYAGYRHEHADYRFDVPPVMLIEPAYIVRGPPPYNVHQQTVPMVPITTTAGPTPRRMLTDDDRRRMCEYHESHPGVKQTEIGGMSAASYQLPLTLADFSSNVRR
jgi:hypothetical protein